jgi:tetratricopeptide (TPR) repeat protein
MATKARDPLKVPAEFWQRNDVAVALGRRDIGHLFRLLRQYCGASQTRIGISVEMTQSTVSLIMNDSQTVTAIAVLERIADGLGMSDDARMRLGLAPKEDIMKRRTALGIGLVSMISPSALTNVLRESAAEALEFTRDRTTSAVGSGTLDHLEATVTELARAYEWRPAGELFPVARAYRHRVEQLINGKHTLKEARELYVRAANLSDLLSDLAHDLGSHLAAEAYAIDSYRHADLAGHDELCAWASSARSSWSVFARRPDKAVAAAEHGLSRAPRHSPIAVRLRARAARAYAEQGNLTACTESLAEAQNLCDRLPDESPSRFSTESRALTSCLVDSIAAGCHNRLGNYREAQRHARDALAVEACSPGEADLNRIELGIALAGLGAPDEAVELGKQALSQPRFLGAVLSRARQLDTVLMSRYPTTPSAQEFDGQYRQLASIA